MIQGIEHTALASPDPAKLAQWYVDVLGFRINYQSSSTAFVKAPNGSMIEIITAEGERAAGQGMKSPGLRHLALSVDDFDATYAGLKEKSVNFLTEVTPGKGVVTVFFADPEGNILHLIQRETPLP